MSASSVKKGIVAIAFFAGLFFSALYLEQEKVPGSDSAGFSQSKFSSKGVVNRSIELKLNYTKAQLNFEKVEISAEVRLPFDFNENLSYKWKLGQNVFLVEGDLTGQLSGLLKNKTKKIVISVTGFSKESNHHIGFEINGISNGKNIYADALIASDIESTFENTVQNVEKIKAAK